MERASTRRRAVAFGLAVVSVIGAAVQMSGSSSAAPVVVDGAASASDGAIRTNPPTTTTTTTVAPVPTTPVPPTTNPAPACDPSYPTVCIPPPPPDLNCDDIVHRSFVVLQPDPHGFDRDRDGIGCES